MTLAQITPKALFPLRYQVKQCAHYITDFQVLYPSGSVIVLQDYIEKRQRYIKLFDKSLFLEMIVLSNSRKYAAIIQNSEKGQILIFDLQTLKKKRVLNLPHESNTNRYETISFTHDDTYIVAITGEPDWNMVVYDWIKGKVSSITKAVPPGGGGTVVQVNFLLIDIVDYTVRSLISFSKGFVYSCGVGYVHLFEKDRNKYKKRNVFVVKDVVCDFHSPKINTVTHLSVNLSQDKLLATTKRAQMYVVRLWGPDLNVAPQIPFKHIGEPQHHGSINGLATCIWKPIFATSGKFDKTVQIWNFETESVLIVKRFSEKVCCIDLHPTGTFIAIGFPSKLEICLILIDDIQTGRTIPFNQCSICTYSFHGNFIAAVSGSVIEIYSTVMYTNTYTLKGHTGEVNEVNWTLDNKKLVSCGADGLILFWDMNKGELVHQVETPGVSYLDIALSADGKFTYAVGDDGLIKEISEGIIIKTIEMNQSVINNIAISRSNFLMFVSAGTCEIMSVKMPLTNPPEYVLHPFHATTITEIKITSDDLRLISVSDGGFVIIWKINLSEDKTVAIEKNFVYSTEVLISKSQLEQHISMMKDLSQKLYEMEMGQARETRDTESKYCESIKELHENYSILIEELKEKIEETETSQKKQLLSMKKEIDDLIENHKIEKQQMIENYSSKLLVEYKKVELLDKLKQETIKNFDEMLDELVRCKEEESNEIIQFYEKKLLDMENELKASHEENIKNIEEHEIDKQYLEDDADRELVETKAKYELILKKEKELNSTLKDEAVQMKKKFAEAQKEKVDFLVKLELLQVEQQKLQLNIHGLEKDISDLKSEIVERDSALKEKDERIFLLRKKMQEMEKYKFVLDYKIKELKNQIDPKDREIREKKEEMVDMETELANLKRINKSLELQVSELREKINGTEKEVNFYEKKNNYSNSTLKQIKIDIYSLYQDLGDFKTLKDGMMKLYHKYYQDDVVVEKDRHGDTDSQREFLRQIEFLEKTITSLRSTLRKNQQNKADNRKVLKDNVVLLEELNLVRKQLTETTETVRNLEKLIGVKKKKSVAPSEALHRIKQVITKKDEMKGNYDNVIKDAERQTETFNFKIKHEEEKSSSISLARLPEA
ncbi:conserved hypothetical protein [Pediculus humanus corporis]|uniref:Uncharacterized protein n=1 Tax=Pediculus humanus subsp. corporis TaxID=121224 RepID=E0VQQ6_PEDHC|nr:uncharacterized protein Phum_PHUM380980 [Pediculus humanus corporis]EEB15712.1 conserved hypothetical protein [Pediculus humanus corporis]